MMETNSLTEYWAEFVFYIVTNVLLYSCVYYEISRLSGGKYTPFKQTSGNELSQVFCLFWQLLLWRGVFILPSLHEMELETKCSLWEMREWFTDSWWAEEEEYKRMLFVVPTVLLPPDGYRVHNEGERKGGPLIHSFAFVDFAFALNILSFTQLHWVDPRAAGVTGTDKRVTEQGWEKGQRHLVEEKKKKRKRREKTEQDERPPESYPRCLSSPLSQWGH